MLQKHLKTKKQNVIIKVLKEKGALDRYDYLEKVI
jgi:hypothetical protein